MGGKGGRDTPLPAEQGNGWGQRPAGTAGSNFGDVGVCCGLAGREDVTHWCGVGGVRRGRCRMQSIQ